MAETAVSQQLDRDPAPMDRETTAIAREELLRAAMETAQQLTHTHRVEAIGHLAAGIAHEINTPTQYAGDNLCFLEEGFRHLVTFLHQQTAVLERSAVAPEDAAYLQGLADEIDLHFLVAEIPRALGQARDGVRRVGEIVSAVKSFAHPGSGEREPTDLNAIVATTLALSRNEWKYVAATATDLEPDLPTVPCFRSEIQQAVLALIIHAAHAVADTSRDRPGGEPGHITIRTRSAGADVELSVSDTGPGIPDAVKPRVFDPFFSIREAGPGIGQSLSFVYDVVVKKHGGSIRFETEVGRGTTFYLRLPQAGTPQEAP